MFRKIECIFYSLFIVSFVYVVPSHSSIDLNLRVPNTPTQLVLKSLSDSEVKLQWRDNSSNEMAFEIYQDGEFLYVADENVTSQVISGLQAGTTYSFKVLAANEVGKSYSTQGHITTDYSIKNRKNSISTKKRKINIVKLKSEYAKKVAPPKPILSVSSIDEELVDDSRDMDVMTVSIQRDHASPKELDMEICTYTLIEDDTQFIDIFPPHSISWSGNDLSSIEEIEKSFNHARSFDKTVSKYLQMPSQIQWDNWDIQQKALYLINSEREARGIKPFEGASSYIIEIAQNYADFLQQIGNIGYYEGGKIPKLSFYENNKSQSKKIFYGFSEKLYETRDSDVMSENDALVKAIYSWIYVNDEEWKNRKLLLFTGLDDNSFLQNREGLIGIGISSGNYQIVTMNAFDPSSSFDDLNMLQIDTTKSALCLLKK